MSDMAETAYSRSTVPQLQGKLSSVLIRVIGYPRCILVLFGIEVRQDRCLSRIAEPDLTQKSPATWYVQPQLAQQMKNQG
jgi:hypothetical protein